MDIKLPKHDVKIESDAFRGCCKLGKLIVPANIDRIQDWDFRKIVD